MMFYSAVFWSTRDVKDVEICNNNPERDIDVEIGRSAGQRGCALACVYGVRTKSLEAFCAKPFCFLPHAWPVITTDSSSRLRLPAMKHAALIESYHGPPQAATDSLVSLA
jgi:hypothetical protein